MECLCRIELRHDFWGEAAPPVYLRPLPLSAAHLRIRGVGLRSREGALDVLAPVARDAGLDLEFELVTEEYALPALTPGCQPGQVAVQRLEPSGDWQDFAPDETVPAGQAQGFARLALRLDPGARDLAFRLRLPCRAADWDYVIFNAGEAALEIAAADGPPAFEELPPGTVDGRPARRFRSLRPLRLAADAALLPEFALLSEGRTLIAPLPVAGLAALSGDPLRATMFVAL